MANPTVYSRWLESGRLATVPMNEVMLLEPGTTKLAIGTNNLNGCSCVVVFGQGIILAHIAPLPPSTAPTEKDRRATARHSGKGKAATTNAKAKSRQGESSRGDYEVTEGEDYFGQKMREICAKMLANRNLFATGFSWGIFARYQGSIALDHLEKRAASMLGHLKFPLRAIPYDTHIGSSIGEDARGTVVAVLGTSARSASLYVEDRLQPGTGIEKQLPKSVASTSASGHTPANPPLVYSYHSGLPRAPMATMQSHNDSRAGLRPTGYAVSYGQMEHRQQNQAGVASSSRGRQNVLAFQRLAISGQQGKDKLPADDSSEEASSEDDDDNDNDSDEDDEDEGKSVSNAARRQQLPSRGFHHVSAKRGHRR